MLSVPGWPKRKSRLKQQEATCHYSTFRPYLGLVIDPLGLAQLAIIVVVPLSILMIVLLVWLNNRLHVQGVHPRAELNKNFLDKFTSGQELAEFIAKQGCPRFLGERFLQKPRPHSTKERILGTVKGGVVITTIGLAMLLITVLKAPGFLIPALIVLSVGLGLLAAAAVSYRLSKAWGLAKDQ